MHYFLQASNFFRLYWVFLGVKKLKDGLCHKKIKQVKFGPQTDQTYPARIRSSNFTITRKTHQFLFFCCKSLQAFSPWLLRIFFSRQRGTRFLAYILRAKRLKLPPHIISRCVPAGLVSCVIHHLLDNFQNFITVRSMCACILIVALAGKFIISPGRMKYLAGRGATENWLQEGTRVDNNLLGASQFKLLHQP